MSREPCVGSKFYVLNDAGTWMDERMGELFLRQDKEKLIDSVCSGAVDRFVGPARSD